MDIGKAEPKLYRARGTSDKYLPTLDLEPNPQGTYPDLDFTNQRLRLLYNQSYPSGIGIRVNSVEPVCPGRMVGNTFFTETEQAVLKLAEEIA